MHYKSRSGDYTPAYDEGLGSDNHRASNSRELDF
jgi:hypothetical protein